MHPTPTQPTPRPSSTWHTPDRSFLDQPETPIPTTHRLGRGTLRRQPNLNPHTAVHRIARISQSVSPPTTTKPNPKPQDAHRNVMDHATQQPKPQTQTRATPQRNITQLNQTHPTNLNVTILLASKSPRRRELLSQAGIPHEIIQANIDDADLRPGPDTDPRRWVAALAYLKAAAAKASIQPPPQTTNTTITTTQTQVILGSDTIVVSDSKIIGQPKDADDAITILRRLNGGTHRVLTGVALLDTYTNRRHLFTDEAEVNFGPIQDTYLTDYVATNSWKGKAGAYNLNERIQAGWNITYTGDPATIMGLPIQRLTTELARFITTTPTN